MITTPARSSMHRFIIVLGALATHTPERKLDNTAFYDAVDDAIDRQVRELSEAKLAAAVEMECASYPSDEAASPEGMHFRRANAGAFFLEATMKTVSRDILVSLSLGSH